MSSFQYRNFKKLAEISEEKINSIQEAHAKEHEKGWFASLKETFVTGLSDARIAQFGLIKQVIQSLNESTLSEEEQSKILTGAWEYVDSKITKTEYNKVYSSLLPGSTMQSSKAEVIGETEQNKFDHTSKYEAIVAFHNFIKATNIFDKTRELGREIFVANQIEERTQEISEETNKEEIKRSIEEESKKLTDEQLAKHLAPMLTSLLRVFTTDKISKDLTELQNELNPPEWKIQRKPTDATTQKIYNSFLTGAMRVKQNHLRHPDEKATSEIDAKAQAKAEAEVKKLAESKAQANAEEQAAYVETHVERSYFFAIRHFDKNKLKPTSTKMNSVEVGKVLECAESEPKPSLRR